METRKPILDFEIHASQIICFLSEGGLLRVTRRKNRNIHKGDLVFQEKVVATYGPRAIRPVIENKYIEKKDGFWDECYVMKNRRMLELKKKRERGQQKPLKKPNTVHKII